MKLYFSRFWHDEPGQSDVERRAANRREMSVVCTTEFSIDNAERRALLLDISRTGAKFGTAVNARDIGLSPGQELQFHVSTPFGADTWMGKVVWFRPDPRIAVWGVEFTREPGDIPLSKLLTPPVVAS